jgi:hypothetical protein
VGGFVQRHGEAGGRAHTERIVAVGARDHRLWLSPRNRTNVYAS